MMSVTYIVYSKDLLEQHIYILECHQRTFNYDKNIQRNTIFTDKHGVNGRRRLINYSKVTKVYTNINDLITLIINLHLTIHYKISDFEMKQLLS